MSANDSGHVNNLDDTQREILKSYWIALISEISTDISKLVTSPMGDELFYLFGENNPDAILLRWLRASKWEISSAVQFMMDTLRWRHEWGVKKFMEKGESELITEECSTSKTYHMGKDKFGRPVTYVHANEHVKGQFPYEYTEKFVILNMELGRYLAEHDIEQGTVVLDMGNVTLKNLDYQHIKFMINTMQNYYPECLGLALVVNAPWAFNTVWNVIRRWLDPTVESKIHFVKSSKDLTEFIDPSNIPQRLEGKQIDFKFIPLTQQDYDRVEIFRQDKQGFNRAQSEHREAAEQYINLTLQWANTNTQINSDRINALKILSESFNRLIPYIFTETHYHRTGIIQQPIFNQTFNRISTSESDQSICL